VIYFWSKFTYKTHQITTPKQVENTISDTSDRKGSLTYLSDSKLAYADSSVTTYDISGTSLEVIEPIAAIKQARFNKYNQNTYF